MQLTLPSAVSSFSELVAVFNGSLTLSNQICVSTAPLRAFIATLAPWYLYQKYTWLAIGEGGREGGSEGGRKEGGREGGSEGGREEGGREGGYSACL